MLQAPQAPEQDRAAQRTLAGSNPGELLEISRIEAPTDVSLRLREMGLGEQAVIRLVSSRCGMICSVGNTRLALSQELASVIYVSPARSSRTSTHSPT